MDSSVAVAQFHLQYFLSRQRTHKILLHLLTRSPRTTGIAFCVVAINYEHTKPRFTRKPSG